MREQDYFFRASDTCLDFQEEADRRGLYAQDAGGDPVPCVLVLSRAADMEMNELSLALAERGIRMARIDADRCLELDLTVYTDAPIVELNQRLLRPVMVWRRHFDITAIPVDPRTTGGAYAVDQWRTVANWLSNRSDWTQVNRRQSSNTLDRLTQLTDASAAGLEVPRTAVTTRPGRSRPGGGACIVKTIGHHMLEPRPGSLRGLFPRPLDARRASELPEPAPVMVQQYLDADSELRVFVIGADVVGYRVDKHDPAQLWVDPDAVSVRPTEVPESVADRLRTLTERWGLSVAAFDLLVIGDHHVFLEVNVNCDWCWFEHRADDSDVSDLLHQWVATTFEGLREAARMR
jgi:hypothetical protein